MGKSLDIIKAPKQKPITPSTVGDRTREHNQDKDSFFNSEPKEEKSDPLLFYLILGLCAIILLVALSVWLIYRSISGSGNSTTSTTTSQSAKATEGSTASETTSSTSTTSTESATATVDKSSVKVRILNGNGRSGEASLVAQALKDDGFVNITTGNAASRYGTTIIYYNTGKLAEAKAVENIVSNKYSPTLKEDASIAKTNDVVVALGDK